MHSTPFRVRHGIIVETSSNTSTAIVANNQVLTGSASNALVDLATAWNTTGNPTAIKLNVTNTASGANSALMDLQVSGNSKFYVSVNGNVGIGTSAPSSSLTIGNAKNIALLSNTTTDGKISFVGSNGNEHASIGRTGSYNLSLYSYSEFVFSSGVSSIGFTTLSKPSVWKTYAGGSFNFVGYSGFGGEVIMSNSENAEEVFHAYLTSPYKIVMPKGDFSIGLTSPTAKFTVANSTNATSQHLYGTYTDASNYERLNLTANSSGHYIIGEEAGTGSARPLYLGSNNATMVTVAASGNIGIGTTTPGYKLHVAGSGSQDIYISSLNNDEAGLRFAGAGTRGRIYTDYSYNMIIQPNAQYTNPYVIMKAENDSVNQIRVGINTTSPDRTLHVNGTARISSVLTMGSYIQGTTQLDLYGDSTSTVGVRITSAGNVGIGNTAPISRLTVDTGISVTAGALPYFELYRSGQSHWKLQHLSNGLGIQNSWSGQTYRSALILDDGLGISTQEILRLAYFGGVGAIGIGISAPTAKLTVANGTSPTSQHLYGTYTDASNYERINLTANSSGNYIIGQQAGTGSARPLYLGANNATAVTIDTAGNLGVGTTSPNFKLTVAEAFAGTGIRSGIIHSDNTNGTSHAIMQIQTGGASGGDPHIFFGISGVGSSGWNLGLDNSDSDKFKISGPNGDVGLLGTNDRFTIDATGNVGIGTSTPSSALDVNGKITTRFGGALRGYFGAPSWDTSYISMQHALLTESSINAAIFQSSVGDTTVNAAVGKSLLLRINNDSGGQGQLEFTSKKFVFSGSNVAIGMTAPTAKFTVADGTSPTSQHIYGTYTDASNYERINLTANSSGHYIIGQQAGTGSPRKLFLGANNATAVTIDTAGNVGIGTTPYYPLQVNEQIRISNATQALDMTPTSLSGSAQLVVGSSTSYLLLQSALSNIVHRANTYHVFENQSGSEWMRITSTGNVGIGTTTPVGYLWAPAAGDNAQARLGQIIFNSSQVAGYTGSILWANWNPLTAAKNVAGWSYGLDLGRNGDFLAINRIPTGSTTVSEFLRITSAGNVGIGTSTPSSVLDINSDGIRVRTAKTPESNTAIGNQGDICWDTNYIYVCTAANTWKRSSISTW